MPNIAAYCYLISNWQPYCILLYWFEFVDLFWRVRALLFYFHFRWLAIGACCNSLIYFDKLISFYSLLTLLYSLKPSIRALRNISIAHSTAIKAGIILVSGCVTIFAAKTVKLTSCIHLGYLTTPPFILLFIWWSIRSWCRSNKTWLRFCFIFIIGGAFFSVAICIGVIRIIYIVCTDTVVGSALWSDCNACSRGLNIILIRTRLN